MVNTFFAGRQAGQGHGGPFRLTKTHATAMFNHEQERKSFIRKPQIARLLLLVFLLTGRTGKSAAVSSEADPGQPDTHLTQPEETQTAATLEKSNFKQRMVSPCSIGFIPRRMSAPNMALPVYLHGDSGKGDDSAIVVDGDGFPSIFKTANRETYPPMWQFRRGPQGKTAGWI